jgi:hypothetical protein
MPKWTPEGKLLDFHAFRTAYCTMVIELGANLKEAMSLMRHTTPELTMNAYAKTRLDRLHGIAEELGKSVELPSKCAGSVPQAVVGDVGHQRNSHDVNKSSQEKDWWRRRESNHCFP